MFSMKLFEIAFISLYFSFFAKSVGETDVLLTSKRCDFYFFVIYSLTKLGAPLYLYSLHCPTF